MIKLLCIGLVVTVFLICSVSASFINPYPRFKAYHDNGDPGEALYLTDLINKQQFDKAKELATVHHPELKWLTSYSGYLTVNAQYNSNMFFWYFPAVLEAKTAPVVLWLQGGPGVSSLFGLFTENGPFAMKTNTTLKKRKFSWHLNHHLIYIDNPVGTGFSFTDDEAGYATNEKDVGNNLYEALKQFFTLFNELQDNDFFITGESYGGKYVPAVGHAILRKSAIASEVPKINLKGLAIGNGLSDPINQINYGDYLYQLGLIDLNGRNAFAEAEGRGIACIKKRDFECAFNVFDELIDMDQTPYGSMFKNLTGFNSYFNYIDPDRDDGSLLMGDFVQMSDTKRAIHVGNNTFHGWEGENKVEIKMKNDIMDSVAEWVSELLSHYKVLVYNGQLDIIVAYPLTENYLQHLKFNGDADYKTAKRMIWRVDGEVAGYVKHAGNLTDVLVRNAGHMVPCDQPKWALDLILRLTSNKGFATD